MWATDITYIPMARGFLYLVAIMDWHSRYVLAWRLSNTLEVDFCVAALEEALSKGRPPQHRPGQPVHQRGLHQHAAGARRSSEHGRQGPVQTTSSWNGCGAASEEVYLKAYQNGTEARKGIGAYLAFYNQERPHQPWAIGHRVRCSKQRCLLEHPQALPSDEGLRDTPAVDSLILASPLS